jgi:hypothetical protein
MGYAPESQVRTRLAAGGRWIRTPAENPTRGKLRLSGPRHQDNSTPNRGEIVSKKGVRASQQLIPSLARDTAPFIYWATGCHCSTQSGSLRFGCRYPVFARHQRQFGFRYGAPAASSVLTDAIGCKVCYRMSNRRHTLIPSFTGCDPFQKFWMTTRLEHLSK